jgi:membrane fusion protein, multidrug efflux system
MRMNAFIYVFPLAVLAQIGCGGEPPSPPKAGQPRAVAASVIRAGYEAVPFVIEAPGTVQPRNRIALSSQINGFVTEMRVRVGDLVRRGQVLATLDARDAESQKALSAAAVGEAEAALGEARKGYDAAVQMRTAAKASMELSVQTFNRYQRLFDARSVSPQELDEVRSRRDASSAEVAARESMVAAAEDRIRQVEARILQAKAQSGRADVLMSWTEIKAPAAGRVVERAADSGSAIFPGSPLLVMESAEKPQAVADIATENAGLLRPGMDVRVRSTATGATEQGRIAEIVPLSDPGTHTIQFKVDMPVSFSLPNGHFVKVEIPAGTQNVLLLPRTALRETGQLTGVFVVDASSKAQFRLIKAAPYDNGRVKVLSGIEPGENIIAAVSNQITDGIAVEIR